MSSNGQGSTGNVIAAICSLIIPGLGQLVQGRLMSAIGWFVMACIGFAITWLLFVTGFTALFFLSQQPDTPLLDTMITSD